MTTSGYVCMLCGEALDGSQRTIAPICSGCDYALNDSTALRAAMQRLMNSDRPLYPGDIVLLINFFGRRAA